MKLRPRAHRALLAALALGFLAATASSVLAAEPGAKPAAADTHKTLFKQIREGG